MLMHHACITVQLRGVGLHHSTKPVLRLCLPNIPDFSQMDYRIRAVLYERAVNRLCKLLMS